MKTSNNIPIIEHEDIINIFTENLRTKRKEKKYTQEQLAGMLGVTIKTYRSWEKDTLPKTIDLINLSIILGCDRGSINQTLLQECIVILIFVLVINIVGFFFLRIFIDRALSPIREMSTVTAEIAAGNFSKRIEIGNRMDEISILARNLNSMADSLEDQEQKRHEFISSISHDLRSPLTSIMGYLQAIIDGVIPEDKLPKYLNIIYSETERCKIKILKF